MLHYCLADVCLVENIAEVVFVWMFGVVSFCYVSFDINCPKELIIAGRVGGHKVPSKLPLLSQIGTWGGPRDR